MSDPVHPEPPVWPVCSEHAVPYVLRRCWSLSGPSRWLWQSDCKKSCKAEPIVHNADGPVEATS